METENRLVHVVGYSMHGVSGRSDVESFHGSSRTGVTAETGVFYVMG